MLVYVASRLRQSPQSLTELEESLKLLEFLQGDLAKTESQILPIHEQFAILEKYDVTVDQDVSHSCAQTHAHAKSRVRITASRTLVCSASVSSCRIRRCSKP